MPATHEPCPDCRGLGHVCDEEADHIHEHEDQTTCATCNGRGLVPIPEAVEPDYAGSEHPGHPGPMVGVEVPADGTVHALVVESGDEPINEEG